MGQRTGPPGTGGEPATVDEALELVRHHGGRVTPSRRLLLSALFSDRTHRTAEELAARVHARAPDIHLSTIYRNLEELERLGVVVHAHLGHGPATYHLASSAHGHFVCEVCGAMLEVPDSVFAGLAARAAERYGFVIDPHHFAVLGRCRDCAAPAPDGPEAPAARDQAPETSATSTPFQNATRPVISRAAGEGSG